VDPARSDAMKRAPGLTLLLAAAAVTAACSSSHPSPPAPTLTPAELMDPQQCQTCHPTHFTDWSGSMHAYASDDPVFLAMNARGQRETNHALGSFCVKCHAPVALMTGATTDGTNLADVPASQKGVTCYFCHSAASVNGTHDNPITLATDGVLRAEFDDPTANTAHAAGYTALLDRSQSQAATLCGSCHDVVNPLGAHIERTFAEWQGTLFSHGALELTCGECHMNGSQGLAAEYPGVPLRRVTSHQFPGVDQALTAFPQTTEQQTAVQQMLDATLQAALCVRGVPGQATIQVVLDNVGAAHSWPSGATQDRRAWVEVIAYANNQVVYESGVVAEGASVVALNDPDLWLIRDCMLDGQGQQVSMFWQAASYESNQLPGPVTTVQTDPRYYLTHLMRNYPPLTATPPMLTTLPDRVTMRVRLVPVGLDVLDDLVQSGDLDASVKAKMPTYDLGGTTLTWTAATAMVKYLDEGLPVLCVDSGLSAATTGANLAPGHAKCSP
jgi:Cytochrome c554 and c-prime